MFEGHERGYWDFMEPLKSGKAKTLQPWKKVWDAPHRAEDKNNWNEGIPRCVEFGSMFPLVPHTCGWGDSVQGRWRHLTEEERLESWRERPIDDPDEPEMEMESSSSSSSSDEETQTEDDIFYDKYIKTEPSSPSLNAVNTISEDSDEEMEDLALDVSAIDIAPPRSSAFEFTPTVETPRYPTHGVPITGETRESIFNGGGKFEIGGELEDVFSEEEGRSSATSVSDV